MKNTIYTLLLLLSAIGYAQTTVTKTASVVTTGSGGIPWWDLENGQAIDGEYIFTEICAGDGSPALSFSSFGFDIPSNAEILGVEVLLMKFASNENEVADAVVSLNLMDAPFGENKALSDFWPDVLTETIYGGDTDLWGSDIAVSEVNDDSFGFRLSTTPAQVFCQNALLDYAEMSVTYSTSLGVEDISIANLVRLTPNPTSNFLVISNASTVEIDEIEVISLSGKVIIKRPYNQAQNKISLAHLPAGVYFVRMSSESQRILKRVIKT